MNSFLKKISTILLMICLFSMMIGSAFAESGEDIKLIGGLEFGMDFQSAVIASGYETNEADARQWGILNENGIGTSKYLKGNGTIGGFPATVYVYFDKSNKLVQVVYYFQESTRIHNNRGDGITAEKETLFLNDYKNVEESLTSAYRAPSAKIDVRTIENGWLYLYDKHMTLYLTVTPSVFPYQLYTEDSIVLNGSDGNAYNYSVLNASQRIVSQSNGSVVIEHSRINYTQRFGQVNSYNIHFVGYTHFDKDYSNQVDEIKDNNSVGF